MTANIQVSGKYPDGRIFVIGGDNADDFYNNVAGILGDTAANQIREDFAILSNPGAAGAVATAAPLRTAAAAAPVQEQANPWGSPPPPGSPTCDHGARVRRTGTSGKGPWVGWFCPTPKGTPGQCSPKFGE
jgi:hypothetical protein